MPNLEMQLHFKMEAVISNLIPAEDDIEFLFVTIAPHDTFHSCCVAPNSPLPGQIFRHESLIK